MRWKESLLMAIWAVAVFALDSSAPAYGLDIAAPPNELRAELSHEIEYLQPLIAQTLSPSERSAFARIRVLISSQEDIASPLADVDASGPYITFTYGLARLVNAVVDAIYGLPPDQSLRYVTYVVGEQKKAVAAANGAHVTPNIKPFYDWANWSPPQISQYRANARLQRASELTGVGVIGFIYAHEVAHHLLGHIGNLTSDFEVKRKREMAADAWASEHLIRADVAPLVGVFAMVYFAALDCNALSHERNLIHPADIRRIMAVVNDTSAGLDRLQVAPGSLSRDDIRGMLQRLSTVLQREIAAGNGCITAPASTTRKIPPPQGSYCFRLDPDSTGLHCSSSAAECESDRRDTINDPDFRDDRPTACQFEARMYCGSRRLSSSGRAIAFCSTTLDSCAASDTRWASKGASRVFECYPFSAQ
jgi:hypothetical protein